MTQTHMNSGFLKPNQNRQHLHRLACRSRPGRLQTRDLISNILTERDLQHRDHSQSKQWRVKGRAQGPKTGNLLSVVGLKLATFRLLVTSRLLFAPLTGKVFCQSSNLKPPSPCGPRRYRRRKLRRGSQKLRGFSHGSAFRW